MESSMDGGLTLEKRLLKETERLLTELGLAHSRQPLVAAVSGGPDSLALLLLLGRLKQPLGLGLHVAHLDHGLRGRESREDARFVERVARDMDLPVTVGREGVEFYRRARGLSLEEAAREARYSFLSRVAAAQGASAVVLGHTGDDQVETILMHLLRGSGLAGFAGMSTIAYWPSTRHKERVALVRPLLDTTKEETAAYCRFREVTPRQDTTNRSMKLTRNRIRLELLPYLREYNPRIREALLRLSGSAAQDLAYLLEAAGQAEEKLAVATSDGVKVERAGFADLRPALKRHLLRLIYQELTGSTTGLEQNHLESMVKLSQGRTGRWMALPGRLTFSVGYDWLRLATGAGGAPSSPPIAGEHTLSIPGDTLVPGWSVSARLLPGNGRPPTGDARRVDLDAMSAGRRLYVRGRRPGDRITPLGMTGSKKLQDFMVDAKIPQEERDLAPLVVSEEGVVWVVGHRIAHWARVREDTPEILRLEFSPVNAT